MIAGTLAERGVERCTDRCKATRLHTHTKKKYTSAAAAAAVGRGATTFNPVFACAPLAALGSACINYIII